MGGDQVLQIDPGALAGYVGMLADVGATVEHTHRVVASDALGAGLDDQATPATGLLREIGEEVGLLVRLIVDVAGAATRADLLSPASAFLSGLVPGSLLAASLADDVGARPVDLADPRPKDDGHPWTDLGFVPVFGDHGPRYTDVEQGGVGDCWLMAVLAGMAATDPGRIERLITDHGDGTYTVHLTDGDVRVDADVQFAGGGGQQVVAYGAGGVIAPGMVLWPSLVEKALAMAMGGSLRDLDGDRAATAIRHLGGTPDDDSLNPVIGRDPSDEEIARRIHDELAAGRGVVANDGGGFGMGGRHVWTVVGIDGADADALVTVYNPWGWVGMELRDGVLVDATDGDRLFGEGDTATILAHNDLRDGSNGFAGDTLTLPVAFFAEQFDTLTKVTRWRDDDARRGEVQSGS